MCVLGKCLLEYIYIYILVKYFKKWIFFIFLLYNWYENKFVYFFIVLKYIYLCIRNLLVYMVISKYKDIDWF